QAVAWIPGRNDLLLMIFFFSSFILLFRYLDQPSVPKLFFHILLLVAALFTKETAVIIPVIMGAFLLIYGKYGWKKLLVPGAGWIVALALFFFVRSKATLTNSWVSPSQMMHDGLSRLGVIVQYLGKIFLPVNLTVFPEADQITLAWGILAAVLLAGLVIWSKSYRKPLTWLGLAWFLIFLVPVLVVPKSLNDQVFEHRLYIPIIGILLMLSQVFPFGETAGRKLRLAIVLPLALIFSVHTLIRIGYFDDSITFWTHAVKGSPRSAYARTLLGTKVTDTTEQLRLFREARSLDPHLKNLNYYLGKVLFDRKQMDSAAWYIRQEVKQNPIPDAYFLLAQIAFLKNDFDSAAILLEKVVELNPTDPQANHNLVLLYWQHGHPEKSKEIIRNMQQRGMEVGDDLLRMVSGK
ncbi:MAG TPA: tetratricopeptide repeat protein, partial [Bacteroidales bacterium]|nr:tetratricopeptide repeat protein [Bacteroidales bacterium]